MSLGNQPAGRRERAAERRVQALELRKGGATYRSIGRALGVSEKTAHQDVHQALAHLSTMEEAAATEVRVLELARLDAIYLGHYPRATAGDDKSARICLAVAERRAALLGIDAPKRTEATGPDGGPIVVTWGGKPPE